MTAPATCDRLDSDRRLLISAGLASVAAIGVSTVAIAAEHAAGSSTGHQKQTGASAMSTLTLKDGNHIFYKDWGTGQPLVFHHGWPLSADDWDNQMMFFLSKGFRVIAHDRRGHGRSSQTFEGNEMNTYAADVAALAVHLDLRGAIHEACNDRRSLCPQQPVL